MSQDDKLDQKDGQTAKTPTERSEEDVVRKERERWVVNYLTEREKSPWFFRLGRAKKLP